MPVLTPLSPEGGVSTDRTAPLGLMIGVRWEYVIV